MIIGAGSLSQRVYTVPTDAESDAYISALRQSD
jgi:hypothetical protein